MRRRDTNCVSRMLCVACSVLVTLRSALCLHQPWAFTALDLPSTPPHCTPRFGLPSSRASFALDDRNTLVVGWNGVGWREGREQLKGEIAYCVQSAW